MKPVLAWMKANLAIVILSALILLILPAAFIGTRMWNKQIQKSRETAANKAFNDLKALSVSYAFPPATPTGTAITMPLDAPNPVANAYFKEHRSKLDTEIAKVADAAKEINQAGHTILVDGLFVTPEVPKPPDGQPPPPDAPKPAAVVNQLKAITLAEMIVGKGDKPSVYEDLLKGINAGGPADPVRAQEALNDEQIRFRDTVKAQHNRDKLLPEEEAELTKILVKMRIGQYQHRASEISVYATRDCLPASLPRAVPSEAPDATTCFEWQFDYWMVSDLLRAVDAANTNESGRRTTLDKSVVKRIDRIDLGPVSGGTEASVTGRHGGSDNKLYDVRQARLSLVVSSAGLPALINAISRTNFMTVIGLDFVEIDPWADLDKGYYYGPDHVVRAVVNIETIWLRSWTEPLMPQSYRDLIAGAPAAEGSVPAANVPTTSRGRGAPPPDDTPAVRPKAKGMTGTKRPTTPKRGGDGG